MGCFVITGKPEAARTSSQTEKISESDIEFHAALQHNDGMLAERIAETDCVSYDEAMNSIEGFVRQVRESLETEGSYLIEKVGAFYLDQHRNIRFNSWETETAQQVFQITGETTVIQKSTVQYLLPRFTVLLALMVIGWFFFNATYQHYLGMTYTVDAGLSADQLPELHSATPTASTVIQQDIIPAVEPATVIESAADAVQPVKEAAARQAAYYIVAGTFKSKDNAERQLRQLKDQGFSDATAYTDERGLHLVAYGSRESRSSASELQEELLRQGLEARVVRH
ncbi:MAG: hypothetical protein RL021_783 [Bacteroidota bacterium]